MVGGLAQCAGGLREFILCEQGIGDKLLDRADELGPLLQERAVSGYRFLGTAHADQRCGARESAVDQPLREGISVRGVRAGPVYRQRVAQAQELLQGFERRRMLAASQIEQGQLSEQGAALLRERGGSRFLRAGGRWPVGGQRGLHQELLPAVVANPGEVGSLPMPGRTVPV